jgi:hypothetical protein
MRNIGWPVAARCSVQRRKDRKEAIDVRYLEDAPNHRSVTNDQANWDCGIFIGLDESGDCAPIEIATVPQIEDDAGAVRYRFQLCRETRRGVDVELAMDF